MSKDKNAETTVTESAESFDEEVAQRAEVETAPELYTDWANSEESPDFDRDQVRVNEWAMSDTSTAIEVLVSSMSLADAEELFYTAGGVAETHVERAQEARQLQHIIASRLREVDDIIRKEEDLAKSNPSTQAMPSAL